MSLRDRQTSLICDRHADLAAIAGLGKAGIRGMKAVVVSRTLRPAEHQEIAILSELNRDRMQTLRAESGKDIWLFSSGELFRSLLAMREVDTVEVNVLTVLLGGRYSVAAASCAANQVGGAEGLPIGKGIVNIQRRELNLLQKQLLKPPLSRPPA